MNNPSRSSTLPEHWSAKRQDEHIRKIARAVNQAQEGKGRNAFRVTLTPNETLTILRVSFARPGSVAVLQAETASAAASFSSVSARVVTGAVEIAHDSSPADDRTFGVVLFG